MTKEEILNLPAGRELDILVLTKVMGVDYNSKDGDNFRVWRNRFTEKADFTFYSIPHYSTDISVAWNVVNHFVGEDCRNQDFFIECWSDGEWFVAFHPLGYSNRSPKANCDGRKTGNPSVPLAICRAALLSVLENE